ncbi:MAG: hypothetical protein AAFY76_06920, partial [Cyanobacteria bacterium J06649_11]
MTKISFSLFLLLTIMLCGIQDGYSQHKLDFSSGIFEEIHLDEFEYLDSDELKNSGDYRLDDVRCTQRVDYNWDDIHFYTDDRGRRIMRQVATRLDNCTPDPVAELECQCINEDNGQTDNYLYRSGGIVSLFQLNDGPDGNPFDDDSPCNPPPINSEGVVYGGYTGIYTGLVEARVRWNMVKNSWPAFWFYNGREEVDIFEGAVTNPKYPGSGVNQFSSGFINHHEGEFFPNGEVKCGRRTTFLRNMSENFHLFSCLWQYDSSTGDHTFTYFIDGREYWTETRYDPWVCPMNIRLNLAVGDAATFPHESLEFEVDYLRVKKFENTPSGTGYYNYVATSIGGGLRENIPAKSMDIGSNDALFYRTSNNKTAFQYISSISDTYVYHTLDNLTA